MVSQVSTCHGCSTAIKAHIGMVIPVLNRRALAVLQLMEDLFVPELITLIMFIWFLYIISNKIILDYGNIQYN